MNKQWMTKYMGQEPANLNSSYLFLVDDPDLALAIAGCGFSSQALAEDSDSQDMYYSIETFISYMNSIDLKGTCRMDYIYVPACSQKWKNNRLNSFFRDNPDLRYHQGWRLFKDREYLADLEYQDELKEALTSFIYRYEGPRGAARFQKQTVDDTTCAGQTEPDPGTDNSWFHVDDTIRTPLHTYNQKGHDRPHLYRRPVSSGSARKPDEGADPLSPLPEDDEEYDHQQDIPAASRPGSAAQDFESAEPAAQALDQLSERIL